MEKIDRSSNENNTSMYIIVYADPVKLGGHSKSYSFFDEILSYSFFDEYNITFFSSTQSLNFPANPKNILYNTD